MAKKPLKPPQEPKNQLPEPAPHPVPAPPAPISRLSEHLGEIEALKTEIEALRGLHELQKQEVADAKVTLHCILKAVKRVQERFGMAFMPSGEFYGIRF